MKNTLQFYLLLITSSLVMSCSSDSSSSDTVVLEKIITYYPQFANFDTKGVYYYNESNQSILDSIFDENENFTSKREFIYASNSKTINTYNNLDVLTKRVIDEYDSSGRITVSTAYNGLGVITFKYAYEYDDVNHIIAENKIEGSSITPVFLFKTNSLGLVYYQQDILNSNTYKELIFDGNTPTAMFFNGNASLLTNFTYYPNPKPINLRISNVEKNNIVLKLGLEHMGYNADSFLDTFADTYHQAMTFDVNDYPLTGHYTAIPSPSLWEDFYYYQ